MYIRHDDRLTDITVDAPEQTTFNPLISRVDLSMIDGQQSIINVFIIIIIVFKPSFKCIITKNKIQINKNSPHNTSENVEKEEEILNNNKKYTHSRAHVRIYIHTELNLEHSTNNYSHTHIYTYKHKRIQTDKLDNKHYTKQGGSIIMITHR